VAAATAAAKRRPSGVLVFEVRKRKGGVVRRPFLGGSRPELIAVSPQPGVAVAIGTAALPLERLKVSARHRETTFLASVFGVSRDRDSHSRISINAKTGNGAG
jgi:hypothetical protein